MLLALQVDNWNQERQERALLHDYLSQMQADLRGDIERAEWRSESTKMLDGKAAYLISVIKGHAQMPIDQNELVSAVLTAGYVNLNLVNAQTYSELISTGNLRLFQDAGIKREIVNFYAGHEAGTQWNTLIQSVQIDYRRATRNLLTAAQYRWARQNLWSYTSDVPPIDMEAFMNKVAGNADLLGVISAMAEIQQRVRDDSRETAKNARTLLDRIETFKRSGGMSVQAANTELSDKQAED